VKVKHVNTRYDNKIMKIRLELKQMIINNDRIRVDHMEMEMEMRRGLML